MKPDAAGGALTATAPAIWADACSLVAEAAAMAAVLVLRLERGRYIVAVAAGAAREAYPVGTAFPAESALICSTQVSQRRLLRIGDLSSTPPWRKSAETLNGRMRAFIGIDLRRPDGSLFGVLAALDTKPHSFTSLDERLLLHCKRNIERDLAYFETATSRDCFRVALDESPAALRIVTPDGKTVYENAAWRRYLDETPREITGGEKRSLRRVEGRAHAVRDEAGAVQYGILMLEEEPKTPDAMPDGLPFECTGEPIFLCDADGLVVQVNQAAVDMLGISPDELTGQPLDEIVRPYDGPPLSAADAGTLAADGRLYLLARRDGPQIPVCARLQRIESREGARLLCVAHDMRPWQAEQRSLQWERDLFLTGPIAVLRCRAVGGFPVEYASPNVVALGLNAADLMRGSQAYLDLVHPADRAEFVAHIEDARRQGRTACTHMYRLFDGTRTQHVYDRTLLHRADAVVTHLDVYLLPLDTDDKDRTTRSDAAHMARGLTGEARIPH